MFAYVDMIHFPENKFRYIVKYNGQGSEILEIFVGNNKYNLGCVCVCNCWCACVVVCMSVGMYVCVCYRLYECGYVRTSVLIFYASYVRVLLGILRILYSIVLLWQRIYGTPSPF